MRTCSQTSPTCRAIHWIFSRSLGLATSQSTISTVRVDSKKAVASARRGFLRERRCEFSWPFTFEVARLR
ncbi:hypothetical protein HMPREF0972_02001 [Actinomyces sp. oral taxon 848 str. F0332]|nr:hypothetical protein HMPREF0972_02001 [Actinomyces sp. oral taxon 848 str. F0332]